MHLIYSLSRDTGVLDTHFVAECHFRCLTAYFRDPKLRVLAPEHSFCIGFHSFLAGTSVLSPGRSLEGGRPAIVSATSCASPAPPGARFSHFRANVEHPRAIFFEPKPHICVVHTWEDPKNTWPASNSLVHFEPLLKVACCLSCFRVANFQP